MSSFKRRTYTRYRRKPLASKYRSSRLAKKNQSAIRAINLNTDLKFKDVIIDDAVISTTGDVQAQIFTIGNGDTSNQKDGLKIVIKQIAIRFQIELPATTNKDAGADIVRMMLLKDKQANTALPAVNDILVGTDIQQHLQPANTRRFTVMFDKTIAINALASFGTTGTGTTVIRQISWQYKKNLNYPIYYNNAVTTGTIAQITSNNLVMLFISEKGFCGIKSLVRVHYID